MAYKPLFIADLNWACTKQNTSPAKYTTFEGSSVEFYRSTIKYPNIKCIAHGGNIIWRGISFYNGGQKSQPHVFLDSDETILIKDCNLYAPAYNMVVIGSNSKPKKIIFDNVRFGVPMTQQPIQILGVDNDCKIVLRNVRAYAASNFMRLSNRHNSTGIQIKAYNCHFGLYPTSDAKKYPFWNGIFNFDDYTSPSMEEALVANQHGSDKISLDIINCQYWSSSPRPVTPNMTWCDKNRTSEEYVTDEEEGLGYVYVEKAYHEGDPYNIGNIEYNEENAKYFPSVSIKYYGDEENIGFKGLPTIEAKPLEGLVIGAGEAMEEGEEN